MEGKLIMKNNKIFALYIILVTNIYLCICFAINIYMKNYVREIKTILAYGVILYAVFLLSYFWFCSIRRKNILLRRKIEKINAKLNKAIIVLQTYITSSLKTYKHYNRTRRKVNKALSGKNIRETFEPNFEEDRTVLKVISLFNKLSVKDVGAKYIHYKNLFVKQKGLQPLPKANKKTSEERCTIFAKDYVALLEGTVKNNDAEIETIEAQKSRENIALYKKYSDFSNLHIEKKLIKKVVVATVCLCILFLSNLVLGKMTNSHKYDILMQYLEEKNYDEAYFLMIELDDFMDLDEMKCDLSKYYVDNNDYNKAFSLLKDIHDNASVKNDISSIRGKLGFPNGNNLVMPVEDRGLGFIIQLKNNGKVTGRTDTNINPNVHHHWKCDVSDWKNIVSIATTWAYSIGLKNDGTVVVDDAYHGYATQDHYIDTSSWKDIVAISGGYNHVVGLRSDGTVVAAGNNDEGQCNVEKWKDIVAIYADDECTIGIRDDGVAITTSSDYDYNYLQNKYGWKY